MSAEDVRREFEEQLEQQRNGADAGTAIIKFDPPYMPALVREYLDLVTPTTSASPVFHYASFMTIVALALGPNLSVRGNERLRPNLFTLLAGPSRFSHKSTAMDYAIDVLEQAGVVHYLLRGLVSIEGMAKLITDRQRPRLLPVEDELTNLFAAQARGATGNLMPRLCELHGLKPRFELNGKDAGFLTKPFTCFLAGITPSLLSSREARMTGRLGFFNRFLVVSAPAHRPLDNWVWPDAGQMNAIAGKLGELASELEARPVSFAVSWKAAERRKVWLDGWYDEAIRRANAGELFTPETNNLLPKLELLAAALDRADEIRPEHTEHAIGVLEAAEPAALAVMAIRAPNPDRESEDWCEEHIEIGRTPMRIILKQAHKVISTTEIQKTLRAWKDAGRCEVLDGQGKRGRKGKDVLRSW